MTSQVQAGFAAEFAPGSDARFVDAVMDLQRLVSGRASPETMYQAVVDGALGLLHADRGSLRFLDPQDPSWMVAVAAHGSAGAGERWRQRSPVTEGMSGQVISTGELVAVEDYQQAKTGSQLAPADLHAIMGVPIRERGQVVGSLLVGSTAQSRRWTHSGALRSADTRCLSASASALRAAVIKPRSC
jgi:GAF domain-containing protein